MKNKLLSALSRPTVSISLALLLACWLAYGILIPWLGFYWDDWPTLWYLNRFGPGVFHLAYGVDRPALGWLFTLTTSLVGESPLAWQIFAILTRWLACLSLWVMLRAVWPNRVLETAWVAFLFALYPGFLQHPIAFTYSADWIAISLLFTSFWLMIQAARGSTSPLWSFLCILLSWLLAAYVMFADEYYFGLELLRPIFLWLVIAEVNTRKRLFKVGMRWLPYLLLMAGFLYWRLVIFVSPRGNMVLFSQLSAQPFQTVRDLILKIVYDLIQAAVLAWVQIPEFKNLPILNNQSKIGYVLLFLLSSALAAWFFYTLAKRNPPGDRQAAAAASPDAPAQNTAQPDELQAKRSWGLQATLIGLIALCLGGWPFWVTDLPIELRFPWDRFNLALMFGACLFLAGLVVWLVRRSLHKALIFGAILGLTVTFHLSNVNSYRQDWVLLKDFFWQLSWRAPGLQPGTLLITSDLPFRYYSDNSLTAPLNLIYAPDNYSLNMSFMLYDIESRLGAGLAALQKNLPVNQAYRAASFSGNTDNSLVFFYAPPRCLKIIDPIQDRLTPNKPGMIDEAAVLSNPDQIQTDPNPPVIPPSRIFGQPPEPNWCYYFLKTELAAQQGDWQDAARLADLAFLLPEKLTRSQAAEFTPFIKAYLNTGRWSAALDKTILANQLNPKLAETLCPIWYDIQHNNRLETAELSFFNQAYQELGCVFSK